MIESLCPSASREEAVPISSSLLFLCLAGNKRCRPSIAQLTDRHCWLILYSAVRLTTGERFSLTVDSETFQQKSDQYTVCIVFVCARACVVCVCVYVRACVRARARACVRAYMRACVHDDYRKALHRPNYTPLPLPSMIK